MCVVLEQGDGASCDGSSLRAKKRRRSFAWATHTQLRAPLLQRCPSRLWRRAAQNDSLNPLHLESAGSVNLWKCILSGCKVSLTWALRRAFSTTCAQICQACQLICQTVCHRSHLATVQALPGFWLEFAFCFEATRFLGVSFKWDTKRKPLQFRGFPNSLTFGFPLPEVSIHLLLWPDPWVAAGGWSVQLEVMACSDLELQALSLREDPFGICSWLAQSRLQEDVCSGGFEFWARNNTGAF